MAQSARTPLPPRDAPPVPLAAVAVAELLAKGLSEGAVRALFPEFTPDDVKSAVEHLARVARGEAQALRSDESVRAIVASAQRNASLSEEDAMALAVEETRAARREKAARRG